jgi:hypothetical protein
MLLKQPYPLTESAWRPLGTIDCVGEIEEDAEFMMGVPKLWKADNEWDISNSNVRRI